jgi:hypothetical protein
VKNDPHSGVGERFQLVININDSSIVGRIGDVESYYMKVLRGHSVYLDQVLEVLLNIRE